MSKRSDSEPVPTACFEGFAWALPRAFAPALADFRFEQGDVLHPEAAAYEGEGHPAKGAEALQVLLPKRSGRTVLAEGDVSRRETRWSSEVELERVDLATGRTEALKTSQGRLVMWLWTGEADWLDPERAAPPVPLPARELASRLPQAEAGFDAAFETRRGSRFLFVVDEASDASRAKAGAIEEALALVGRVERLDRSAPEAGVDEAESFLPTLRVRGIAVAGASEEAVQQALRGALYGGGAAAESEAGAEAAPDRFSVTRHGLLAPLGGA